MTGRVQRGKKDDLSAAVHAQISAARLDKRYGYEHERNDVLFAQTFDGTYVPPGS